jgi:RNA polymerase sigma-B factor
MSAQVADQVTVQPGDPITATETRMVRSLDRPAGDDTDQSLGDLMAAPGPREEREDLLVLADLLAGLPELERQVVVMRFFQDLNQDDVAARVGCSQMQVSRLLRRALDRLRAQLVEA